MDARDEMGLLRLAVARGLLTWEDVVAAAGRRAESDPEGDPAPGEGRWLGTLIAAGRLRSAAVEALRAELDTRLPETVTHLPAAGAVTATVQPGAAGDAGDGPRPTAPPSGRSVLEPELRFLANWPRYRIEGFLGAGGMGSVYKAFDPALNRYVAIKFLHRNDPTQTEQFLREARSQARVDHPNICRVYEVGEVEDRPYIAMQFIDGRNLADVHDVLPVESKVRLVRDVARAVHAAHRTGLIHRDLKPGNILVGRDDAGQLAPQVVDFGLARDADDAGLTRPGSVTGTPAYLSPEQAQGKTLDRRTDVYSLGVVLYELLGGRPPFQGPNPPQTLVRLIQDEAVPLSKLNPAVARDLETVVMKCLEKDPAQRYGSARALADDLDRWLAGDPIEARPAGWAYRMGKRLRKNRTVATVAAAAVVALVALGSVTVRNHWRALETAELAQRFGQQVKEVEDTMRLSALLPRHDISAHKAELGRQLEGIQTEMARLGPLAAAPGHAALGRGFLALHRYEMARDHLEAAWRAGHHTPEIAASLGRAMGLLYERALVDTAPDQVDTAREEIERTLRRPALSYLNAGLRTNGLGHEAGGSGGSGDGATYVDGLIALYEGRFDEALTRAREAQRRSPPWFYEADQLEAEVYATRGDASELSGHFDDAIADYDRARDLYRGLIGRAPSDPALYAAQCGVEMRRLQVETQTGRIGDEEFAAAVATCDLALAVDPELTEALHHKARILWRWGELHARLGEDPRPQLEAAIALCRRAIALNPSVVSAYQQLTSASRLLAVWQMGRGIDPGPAFEQSIAAARTAVELQPDLATAYNTLATAYLELARHLAGTGGDPRPTLELAIESYRKAIARAPRFTAARINSGAAWKLLAEQQLDHGQDPSESLAQAALSLERAVAVKPTSATLHNNLGTVHLTLADFQFTAGRDPREALERAAASYRRAIELNPDYQTPCYNLGFTLRALAEYRLSRGDDIGAVLAEADRALDRALDLNATDADNYLERARVDLVAARAALGRGASPAAALAAAGEALDRAGALNPREPEVFLTRALGERIHAEWRVATGHDPAGAVRTGLAMVEKAAAISPLGGRCRAVAGSLLQLGARGETDPARRREEARQAVAALEEALAANRLLAHEYGPVLAAARGLAEG